MNSLLAAGIAFALLTIALALFAISGYLQRIASALEAQNYHYEIGSPPRPPPESP